MTSTKLVVSRVLSAAARLVRQGLVKKAQDRYNEGQPEREMLNMYYTAMKVGDRLGSTILADDGEVYNTSEYRFPKNLVTLATYARVYVSTGNRDAGLELFRYNVDDEEWSLRITSRNGDWKEGYEVFKPIVLSPARVDMIYSNWTSGLDASARFTPNTLTQYAKEARFVDDLNVILNPGRDFAYVPVGTVRTEKVAIAVLLGYTLPYAYNDAWVFETVSPVDLALWLFGAPKASSDKKDGDGNAEG